VALVAASDAQRDQAGIDLAKLRRQRLDEAFDEDARMRDSIDADWVIEARRAYAVALDAYAKTQAADERAAIERKPTAEFAPVMTRTPPGNSFARTVLPESRERGSLTSLRRTSDSSIRASILCFEFRFAISTVGWTAIIGPGAWWIT
jgi:hypothetical protein